MSYLSSVTLAVIGTPPLETLKEIEESVKNGGGIFDSGGVTNETTHAILVDKDKEKYKEEIALAVEIGAVVLEQRWLEVILNL